MCEIVCWRKSTWYKQQYWRILHENDTKSRIQLKKIIYKKLRCNSTVKIRFGRKKILNYAYVLKNGVGRYTIFFKFLHKAGWILLFVSFSCRIRQCFCLYHVLFLQQTISHMLWLKHKHIIMYANSDWCYITKVSYYLNRHS
jgi:hypothetical protein